jgi:hypothetical protein
MSGLDSIDFFTEIGGDPEHKIAPDPLAYLDSRFTSYMQERRGNPRGDMPTYLLRGLSALHIEFDVASGT